MSAILPTLLWATLLIFGAYNFLGAAFNIGIMREMLTVTPKMYWAMIFPIGLMGVYIFGMLTWFGIKDILWEIKYND